MTSDSSSNQLESVERQIENIRKEIMNIKSIKPITAQQIIEYDERISFLNQELYRLTTCKFNVLNKMGSKDI